MAQVFYEPGAVRWKRPPAQLSDVRLYRPPAGWKADLTVIDNHPSTGRPFKQAQWWIREEYVG